MIIPPMPENTAHAAHASFGRSNFYISVGEHAGALFSDLMAINPPDVFLRSKLKLSMLYLITIFQYLETLPDQGAAEAIRERVDWKFALHLPMVLPGLDPLSFCEFRRWVLSERTAQENLQALLLKLSFLTDFSNNGRLRVAASDMIVFVCHISRLARIWEALNQSLETLATTRPDWLLNTNLPHWYERYGRHQRNLNLSLGCQQLMELAQTIGADGVYLLDAISRADPELGELDEILALRSLWRDQFETVDGKVRWRKGTCAGCTLPGFLPQISSQIKKENEEVWMIHGNSNHQSIDGKNSSLGNMSKGDSS